MTEEDILDVIDRFVFTAKIARETGFTGIQFHSAHGYLLSEFLSPDINNRSDAWGGSLENRARIHLEIIKKCRKEVGEDFPISVKLNSADFQKGGFTPDESIQVAQMLENAGVDIIIDAAGFANDVEDVNQYAAPIYAATDEAKFLDDEIKIIKTNPNVANTSLTKIFVPDL